MTLDEIIGALKTSDAVPKAGLAAGVAHADALAPLVFAVAGKFCRGIYLLPADNKLLFYGLNILAAARQPALLDQLLALARQPIDDLDRVFPHHTPISLQRLLLSAWDREAGELFQLIEHADLEPEVKWALYDVMSRLTFDGRIARTETSEFLARIERDGLIDDGDMTWWGWAEAVDRLGLIELEPALHRVWAKPIYEQHTDADRAEALESMKRAAANPSDPNEFDADDIRPIDDPVEAVAWVEHRAAAMVKWDAEHGADDADPVKTDRLTIDEHDWLAGFLVSRQAPDGTMSFEMLDGFFTALVIGPEMVPPSEYLAEIWGTDDGGGPAWDSTEQAEFFFALLMKHWNAIAARRSANAKHLPHIEQFGEALPGEEWADGFLAGIDMRADAWQPIFDDRRADQIVLSILALTSDAPDEIRERFTLGMRKTTLEQLPVTVQMIAVYWRDPQRGLPRQEPVRTSKVGRNAPCPCGSGLKYKKCCGSGSTSTLH
jgi:uncharacterized protein